MITRLSLKGKHIKDYWQHFDNIFYCVSLDQVGKKAEYTRAGQTWDTVFTNLSWIRDNFEHSYDKGVVIQPNPTISALNVVDLRSIVNYLFEHNIPTDYDINLSNLLVGPDWLSCTILPENLKSLLGGAAYLITGISRPSAIRSYPLTVKGDDFQWHG